MSDKIVTLASFGSLQEAYLAKNLLENEGIQVSIADETSVGNLFGNALGDVKLLVAEADLAEAERALDRHEDAFHQSSAEITEKTTTWTGRSDRLHGRQAQALGPLGGTA